MAGNLSSTLRVVDHLSERKVRMIGTIGWAVIFAVIAIWQGFALANGPAWPTVSAMIDVVMRPFAGRALMFALWLWIGWHTFVRGWEFFLRSP
jgi:hypothetical protein